MRKALICFAIAVAQIASAQQSPKASTAPVNAVLENGNILYRYQNDGTGEIVESRRYKVLTETGLRMLGEIFLPYSSQLEKIKIDYLRTVKPDGTEVAADPSKALDITPPVTRYAPTFSDVRLKVLIPPQLQVGDSVEYQYTRTITVPFMKGQFWVTQYLERAYPITSETITLDVPAGRALTFEADPCFHFTRTQKKGRVVYAWDLENLKPPKNRLAAAPPLFAASTLSNWKQVGDWYLGLQSGQTDVTPAIAALAKKLTAGMTTPQEKTDAIYTYVSEKIRYVALEFGIGGYKAHAASDVLASGYGDCKDKAGLLQTLLAAAGIASHPVLVNAVRSKIEPAVPMPSQFDHVINVVSLGGKTLWLDSTMETAPPGVLSPLVRGKQGLLVEANASKLVPVPAEGPRPDEFDATVTGSLNDAGTLKLDSHLTVYGFAGAFMRSIFRLQDKNQVKKVMKAIARSQLPGSTVSGSSSSDPDDLSGPFKFQYVLTRDAFVDLLAKSDKMRIPVYTISPNHWARELSAAEQETKDSETGGCAAPGARHIKLNGPAEYDETMDISVPPNYEVDLPIPIQVNRPFGSYSSSYSFSHGQLIVKRRLDISKVKIPLTALQDLENFQSLINSDLTQSVTLRRTGAGDILSGAASMSAKELIAAGTEALYKHRNPVLARDLFLRAVAKDSKSKYGWNDLGLAKAAMGDTYGARKAYKKQIALDPYDQYAYTNLGLLEMAKGNNARAVADIKQQLSVNPLDLRSNASLESAYEAERDMKDAAQAASTVVRLSPQNAAVYVEWGTDLLRSGQPAQGRSAIQRAFQLSKGPMILNNAAFGMAEAGVDLPQAEQDVRSAIDQIVPENVDSPDVSKNYDARMTSLGAFLDTLGWVLFKEGKFAAAKPYLDAAFEISRSPDVAQHLARLSMRLGDPAAAARYYSFSVAQVEGPPVYTPPELLDYLRAHGGAPAMTPARCVSIHRQIDAIGSLTPAGGSSFTWPAGAGQSSSAAPVQSPAFVVVNALTDEAGAVSDAKVAYGSASYANAALADVKSLRFPPLAWPGHLLKTARSVTFIYDPAAAANHRVTAFWTFYAWPANPSHSETNDLEMLSATAAAARLMDQGDVNPGVALLRQTIASTGETRKGYTALMLLGKRMRQIGNFEAAAAIFQEAASIQPKIDFAWRELAETLKETGDVAGAVKAYQQAIAADPGDAGYHYALGSEYELEAGAGSVATSAAPRAENNRKRKRAAAEEPHERELSLALGEYGAASHLQPGSPTYRSAYERLYERINHAPPPAATPSPVPPQSPRT